LEVVGDRCVDLVDRALKRLAPLRVREVQRVHVELDRLIVLYERGGESQGCRRHDHVRFLLRIPGGRIRDDAEGSSKWHWSSSLLVERIRSQGTNGRRPITKNCFLLWSSRHGSPLPSQKSTCYSGPATRPSRH